MKAKDVIKKIKATRKELQKIAKDILLLSAVPSPEIVFTNIKGNIECQVVGCPDKKEGKSRLIPIDDTGKNVIHIKLCTHHMNMWIEKNSQKEEKQENTTVQ